MKKTLAQLLLAFLKSRQILTLVPICIVLHIYSVMSLIHSKHLWEITDPYILSGYFLSYEKGFIPRGLIGTVYSFITKFISGNMFFALLFAGTILFYLFCFYLLLFRIRTTEDRNTGENLALAGVLLFSLPPVWTYTLSNFARFDIFLFAITLFSVISIFRDSYWKYLVLLLVPAGVMIHEIFLILFLPLICATAFYKTEWKNNRSILYLFLLFLSCMGSLYILFLMRKNMPSAEVLDALCVKNNNMGNMDKLGIAIYADKTYLQHLSYAFRSTMLTDYALGYIVSIFVFLAAGFYPFTLWKKAYQNLPPEEKALRWKFIFLLIAALIPNLACIIATDHARWQTAFLLDINLAVFLLYSDEKLSLKLPAPSPKTVQWVLWASAAAMVCGMTTECHFSNVLTGICLKIARGFKYICMLFFS